MFIKFGELDSCKIKANLDGTPSGVGYVSFKKSEDA